jgi:transitional endoplasmic reticulum ATPase
MIHDFDKSVVNSHVCAVDTSGKTLLVKSIVNQLPGTFINIKISDVLSGSVGESSVVIRDLFQEAKKLSPSVVFIDEFQALFSARRGDKQEAGSGDSSLMFSLIGCLDDIVSWNSTAGPEFIVTIMAATNEPWAVDEILLRSGRFDKIIFVGPMSAVGRKELLMKLVACVEDNIPVADIDYDGIVQQCDGFTGADIKILFQKACHLYSDRVLLEKFTPSFHQPSTENGTTLFSSFLYFNNYYFDDVLRNMSGSCSKEELEDYANWGREFQSKIW